MVFVYFLSAEDVEHSPVFFVRPRHAESRRRRRRTQAFGVKRRRYIDAWANTDRNGRKYLKNYRASGPCVNAYTVVSTRLYRLSGRHALKQKLQQWRWPVVVDCTIVDKFGGEALRVLRVLRRTPDNSQNVKQPIITRYNKRHFFLYIIQS